MEKTLDIPVCQIGRLIGQHGRNIYLVNQLIEPGHIMVTGNKVTIYGDFEDKRWSDKAIRVIRSVRRGGIIKWFGAWERQRFNKTPDQPWLESIRGIERRTNCFIKQLNICWKDEMFEVWVVLENNPKTSDITSAIKGFGTCVHRRYRNRTYRRK